MIWFAIGWLACMAVFLEAVHRAEIIGPDEER
jgi:hypothetical protein